MGLKTTRYIKAISCKPVCPILIYISVKIKNANTIKRFTLICIVFLIWTRPKKLNVCCLFNREGCFSQNIYFELNIKKKFDWV
jgi:hypothetical protein